MRIPNRNLSVMMVGVFLALAACVSVPWKNAETIQQNAYAGYGTFVIFQEQALVVINDASVPLSAKTSIRSVERVGYAAAEEMRSALKTYEAAVIALDALEDAASESDRVEAKAKLSRARAEVDRTYQIFKPQLLRLMDAVKGAKR